MLRLETEYSINVEVFLFWILRADIYVACTFNINRKTMLALNMKCTQAVERNNHF